MVYVGHFWTLGLIPTSAQSLLYTHIFFLRLPLFRKCTWVGLRIFYPVCVQGESVRDAQTRVGGVGSCRWQNILLWCARKIIMVRDLLRQYEAWSWVPVRFPFLQGNGDTSSSNHVGLWPHNFDCNPAVDPSTYVWKGFLGFCHHELTQNREYNEGLIPEHAI